MLTVNYGKDWVKVVCETLEASDIKGYLSPGMAVSIKPNLVNATPADRGATTHPEVVEGIIKYLIDYGIKDIKIMESSAVGYNTKKAYKVCGYEALEKKYGVNLIDLKSEPTQTLSYNGMDIEISKPALDSEFLINVPVLKAHCQTRLTCCMKNLKGCIPEREMKRFHTMGLHKPIAALSALLPVHYCVVDGICGDLSFEEGGTPVEANRIIAGRDPVLIDTYCAGLIGYKPEDIGYLPSADLNINQIKIVELNSDEKPVRQQKSDRLSDRYSAGIEEDAACSVCYAALMYAQHRSHVTTSKKLCIGQGFKGKSGGSADIRAGGTGKGSDNIKASSTGKGGDIIGIGSCTRGFDTYVEGCPPKAVDIIEALRRHS